MKTGRKLIDEIDGFKTPAGSCAFWWLGQHSFAVKIGDAVCYLDPYLKADKSRLMPQVLQPVDMTNAAIIFGSHDHGDHIDRAAWPEIAKASPGAVFVVPMLLRQRIVDELRLPADRVLGVDVERGATVGGIKISAVPAAHEFLDLDPATGLHPYLGFVIEANDFCIYHSGDTCIYEGMQAALRRWRIDLTFLPINGRDAKRLAANCIGNMTYQEAADLAGAIRPGLTVPAHYGMFEFNTQAPQPFADYMKIKYPHLAVKIPVLAEPAAVKSTR
ncbi:MAG: MBL fold metallo-hydrolase [Planctomycetes bacterium]|nr:MBL fold metallo-hydrolase [Planctomycetota bacterium]